MFQLNNKEESTKHMDSSSVSFTVCSLTQSLQKMLKWWGAGHDSGKELT